MLKTAHAAMITTGIGVQGWVFAYCSVRGTVIACWWREGRDAVPIRASAVWFVSRALSVLSPCSGTQTPARFGSEALEKIEIVGPLRRLANQFIEPLRILADENAPPVGFDPVEDNGRRARRTDRGLLAKATFALGNYLPDVLI